MTLPLENRFDEFFSMTGIDKSDIVIPKFEELPLVDYSGIEIQEGNRKRTEHFRIERSPLLKRYYKQAYPEPVCRACGKNMQSVYPWTGYMLDVHHLLPFVNGNQDKYKGNIFG